MNWRTVRAIATKDLLEVRKNRIAIWSILGLSFFLSVGMPLLIGLLPFAAGPSQRGPRPVRVAHAPAAAGAPGPRRSAPGWSC